MSEEESIAFCEELFADVLGGHRLVANSSLWIDFATVRNARWRHGNVVLLGDAAHTAHFSIGSGTKLAMEDAIALAWAFREPDADDVPAALAAYEAERRPIVESTQRAAQASLEWFEGIARYMGQDPRDLRVQPADAQPADHLRQPAAARPRLRRVGRRWRSTAGRRCSRRSGCASSSWPTASSSRRWTCTRRSTARRATSTSSTSARAAIGGAGLVMTEMICVSAEGRITPGCGGLYRDEHTTAWRRIVDFVHAHGDAKIGAQLGHSGRKGSTKLMWEGEDEPLDEGDWPLLAPSPLPYLPTASARCRAR